jgi:dienelactone hydrolase
MQELSVKCVASPRPSARGFIIALCATWQVCGCQSAEAPAAVSGTPIESALPLAIARAVSTQGAPSATPRAAPTPNLVSATAAAADAPPTEIISSDTVRSTNFAVGTMRVMLDVTKDRRIPVQLWYPAVESARVEADAGHPVFEFEPSGSQERAEFEQFVRDADPRAYTQRTMHAALAPAVLESLPSFPLVVASHCDSCIRFAYFTSAERLASHGFVVAAPDHIDDTIYNEVAGDSTGPDLNDFLDQRRHDALAIIDTLLDANAEIVPQDLRGKIDASRVGMFGHSYGALTTSLASGDPRIRAVAFLAMLASAGDNLPFAGDQLAQRIQREPLSKPSLFIMAQEDLVSLAGVNDLIRENYADYPTESWLATLSDAGHYSVCTLCGIRPEFTNCYGSGIRLTRFPEPFNYLDLTVALDLTASLLTTFFELQLLGASGTSMEAIATAAPKNVLTIEHHR